MNEKEEKFAKSVVRMLDDEIIKIREKYEKLRNMEFAGPAIIMLLANNELDDDDLYFDYYNKDNPEYHVINTKKEALEYIKNGNLKYLNVAYSNKYIDNKIIDDIKDYIKNFNKFDNYMGNGNNEMSKNIKTIMIAEIDKFFIDCLEEIQDEVLECSETIADIQREKDIDEDDFEDYYEDDEFIDLDEYDEEELDEYDEESVVDLVDKLLEVDDIDKYIKVSKIEEFKDDRLMFDSMKKKSSEKEILDNDEYFTYIVKKYYDKKFGIKNTIYLKPSEDMKYDFDKTKDEKYRIMIADIYNQLNIKYPKDDSLSILVDILKQEIKINSNYYDSYFYDIKDYNELLQNLRYLVIIDYYNSKKDDTSSDMNELYTNLILQQKDNKDILDSVFIYDKFGKIVTKSFVDNSLIDFEKHK